MPSLRARITAVDNLVAPHFEAGGPGAAIGIRHDGEANYRFIGKANLEHDIPISSQTVFHVASVSKQFTAIATALLADEGRLDLDGDIRGVLGWFPDFGTPITALHLITHTSGLNDQWDLLCIAGRDLDDHITQQQALNVICSQQELAFTPGSEHRYCNSGYTLLAEIVRELSGKTLTEFCDERFFKPLRMTHTRFVDDVGDVVAARASSYERRGDRWMHLPLHYGTFGATNLHTTVGDLISWSANLMDRDSVVGSRIDALTRTGTLTDGRGFRYAFGLLGGEVAGLPAFGHTGGDAGFSARLVCWPKQDFSVAILANTPIPIAHLVEAIAVTWLDEGSTRFPINDGRKPARADQEPSLAGAYYAPTRQLLRIVVTEEGGLVSRSPRGAETPVFLDGDVLDFGTAAFDRYKLRRSAEGDVVGLELVVPPAFQAEGVALEKVTPEVPEMAELQQFAGRYRCDALDVSYDAEIRDDRLVLSSVRRSPVPLSPSIADRFDADGQGFGSLVFERAADRRVLGFSCVSGRHRNVRFARVD